MAVQPAKERDRPLIFMRRIGEGLVPWSEHDADLLSDYGGNVKLRCEVWEARSNPQNRFYWSVLRGVCRATGRWGTAEHLHKALKLRMGFVDAIERLDGTIHLEAQSTAFNAMPQPAWEAFMEAAYELIQTEICPGTDKETLIALGTGYLATDEKEELWRRSQDQEAAS